MSASPGRATLLGPAAEPYVFPYGNGDAFSEVVAVANPAAGTLAQVKIPGQYITRINVVTFRFVTSATVAARIVRVEARDPDGVAVAIAGPIASQAASITADYSLFSTAAAGPGASNGLVGAPLFDMFMEPGYSLVITATNIQAGDQLSRVRLALQRLPTRQRAPLVFEAN